MQKEIYLCEVDFPDSLGETNEISKEISHLVNGCKVIDELVKGGYINKSDIFFDDKLIYNILSNVHDRDYFPICQSSQFCAHMADIMTKGEYVFNDQAIQIGKDNEKYKAYEGKHRVCIAKQFGIEKLPMDVID